MALSPSHALAAARFMAASRTPYFTSALVGLVPRESTHVVTPAGVPTIGVTPQAILMYHPEAVTKWTTAELAGALVHEIGHLLRKHAERFAHCTTPELRVRANMAGDLSMNDDIKAMGFELPAGGLFPENFGFKANLTSEEYYRLLEKRPPPPKSGSKGSKSDGAAGKQPGCGSGHCGGCSGNPMEGEPDDSDPAGRSEAEIARMAKQVAEQIRQAQSQAGVGSVPGGWQRWASEILKPAKVRWQDKLSRVLRGGIVFRAGAVDHTYHRISRRQAGIGYGPGKPVMPALHAPIPEVDVVTDTSGSMGDGELTQGLRETAGIIASTGARVRFSSCDAEVHALKTVSHWKEILPLLKGGGGTAFQPVFDLLMRQRRKPAVIVFITDGGCFDKPEPPPGVRVIWLLVGAHKCRPTTWGEFIELDD